MVHIQIEGLCLCVCMCAGWSSVLEICIFVTNLQQERLVKRFFYFALDASWL